MAVPLRAGVHSVVATPFLPDESLDLASIDTLVAACVHAGCDGLLVLGVLGEADRLSDAERDRVVDRFLAKAGGDLQITVGITHPSTIVTGDRARAAARAGATAVMVSPPVGSAAGPALRDHFRRAADGLDCTFVVQDHPASSGVKLPVDFLASLAADLPSGSVVKLEDPPTASKIAALRQATDAYQIFGGLGGVSLLYELQAGSAGTMTGFALPELLVALVRAWQAGDAETARRVFEAALPLMVFEAQPGAGVALRKEILRRRGAITHGTVRQPAPRPDATLLAALEPLLAEAARIPVPAGVGA
jgi:4-hydroxy-tetrahydrodipicolinate synthase